MMKKSIFLALPVITTVANLLFATLVVTVFHPRAKVSAQLQPGNFFKRFINRPTESEPGLTLEQETKGKLIPETDDVCDDATGSVKVLDEKDPQLKAMPIPWEPFYFDAYTRKDISSMYQEEEGSRVEKKPQFNGQAAKFINLSNKPLQLFWEDDDGKHFFISNVGPFEAGGTASFPTHKFVFKTKKDKQIVSRFIMKEGTMVYYYDPFVTSSDDDEQFVANRGTVEGVNNVLNRPKLSDLSPDEKKLYDDHRKNLEFATLYKNFTGGSEWLSMYGYKNPPLHPIWRADYYGQEHHVISAETHFKEIPPMAKSGDNYAVKRNATQGIAFPEYREPGKMNITIKAVSVEPRAFQIENFLSEVEVDHILDVLHGQYDLKRSTTGSLSDKAGEVAEMSSTRTSRNTWVPRTASPVLDAIFRRGADALRMDEALLRRRAADEPYPRGEEHAPKDRHMAREPINEQMQIVHYDAGQEYTAHHDFGYSEIPTRSINLCIYLNEGMKGGETKFPRARSATSDDGVAMTPQKGKAMIFYMVNPDGNVDDLTQHAAMPVLEGEKYFANLWIWDPFRL